MNYSSIVSEHRIYECSNSFTLTVTTVEHELFQQFCFNLKKFMGNLGNLVEDEYWKKYLRMLKRYRFEMMAAPVSYAYGKTMLLNSNMEQHLSICDSLYSSHATEAQDLFATFVKLVNLDVNPLLDTLLEMCDKDAQRIGIVLVKPKLIPTVQEVMANYRSNIEVVGESELRSEQSFSKILLIGPACWFHEYVLTAPRASEINIVRYSWVFDYWNPKSVLIAHSGNYQGNNPNKYIKDAIQNRAFNILASRQKEENLDPGDIFPKIDWQSIKNRAISYDNIKSDEEEEIEYVEAYLVLLVDDVAVLLDSSEGAKTTIIDLDRLSGSSIIKISVDRIESGMYLLLRTEGGGEYIYEMANYILGDEAEEVRRAQNYWKSLLRKAILAKSLQSVITELKQLGSLRANEVNVRNWASYRSIKTEQYIDFQAIMKLIGLENETRHYWDMMSLINSAHKRAGQSIRRQLLDRVRSIDLTGLQKTGKMEFHIEESGAGSITAFRVQEVQREPIEVPYFRLNKPFDMEEY